jgi:hypothetical protein
MTKKKGLCAPTFAAHLSAVDVRAEYQRAEMGGCLFFA